MSENNCRCNQRQKWGNIGKKKYLPDYTNILLKILFLVFTACQLYPLELVSTYSKYFFFNFNLNRDNFRRNFKVDILKVTLRLGTRSYFEAKHNNLIKGNIPTRISKVMYSLTYKNYSHNKLICKRHPIPLGMIFSQTVSRHSIRIGIHIIATYTDLY